MERGLRGGQKKWVRVVSCIVSDGNKTFGGEHSVVYTESKYIVVYMTLT